MSRRRLTSANHIGYPGILLLAGLGQEREPECGCGSCARRCLYLGGRAAYKPDCANSSPMKASNFAQVIATTHQRLWRDIYRYQHGAGRLTQMIELQRWSLSKGISNFKTRLAVDDLIASIAAAPFDRQVTASRAGILLEAVLDWLALQYRCRVARTHDGSYTLGELQDGTESLFKKLEIHRPDLDTCGQPRILPDMWRAK